MWKLTVFLIVKLHVLQLYAVRWVLCPLWRHLIITTHAFDCQTVQLHSTSSKILLANCLWHFIQNSKDCRPLWTGMLHTTLSSWVQRSGSHLCPSLIAHHGRHNISYKLQWLYAFLLEIKSKLCPCHGASDIPAGGHVFEPGWVTFFIHLFILSKWQYWLLARK